MAKELSKDDLRRFARLGAMRRLEDIRQEEASIRAAFPELFRSSAAPAPAPATAKAKKARRRRSTMSADARRAVSERMKKYWAGRRKAKNG